MVCFVIFYRTWLMNRSEWFCKIARDSDFIGCINTHTFRFFFSLFFRLVFATSDGKTENLNDFCNFFHKIVPIWRKLLCFFCKSIERKTLLAVVWLVWNVNELNWFDLCVFHFDLVCARFFTMVFFSMLIFFKSEFDDRNDGK